jgi:hypothetical protein
MELANEVGLDGVNKDDIEELLQSHGKSYQWQASTNSRAVHPGWIYIVWCRRGNTSQRIFFLSCVVPVVYAVRVIQSIAQQDANRRYILDQANYMFRPIEAIIRFVQMSYKNGIYSYIIVCTTVYRRWDLTICYMLGQYILI